MPIHSVRWIFLVPGILSLAACAPLSMLMGFSQPAVQAAVQVDQAKVMADGVSFLGSGKTITDHVLSTVTGDDCRITNIFSRAPICVTETADTQDDLRSE